MFGFVDLNALLLGVVFGLALSIMIVAFLIHAAIHTPQAEEDRSRTLRPGKWTAFSGYEGRRAYLHVAGHDPDFEW